MKVEFGVDGFYGDVVWFEICFKSIEIRILWEEVLFDVMVEFELSVVVNFVSEGVGQYDDWF